MDKKTKKKIDILRKRLQKLKQQVAGAKQQDDEPGEIKRLEEEIQQTDLEIENLQSS